MSCTTARTANEIIEGAFKIIGIFSEERNLSGKRLKEGLDVLNELLSTYRASAQLIAYDSTITFNLVVGQRQYEISEEISADVNSNPLVRLKFVTIENDNLQYPIQIAPDNLFYTNGINLNRSRRPTQVFLQQDNNASFLNFFVKPELAYLCTVKGKFVLDDLTLNTDITTIPRYYTLYLKSALGRLLHPNYDGSKWDAVDETQYTELKEDVMSVADIDLITETSVALVQSRFDRSFNFNAGP